MGQVYLDRLRSCSIVAFSLQYCSTNLLLTSAASLELEECTAHHSRTYALPSPCNAIPAEGGNQDDPPPIGREGGGVTLHLSKLWGRQLG